MTLPSILPHLWLLVSLTWAAVCLLLLWQLSRWRRMARRQNQLLVSTSTRKVRYEAIVAAATDGIIALDMQRRVLAFNPVAETIFGYKEADLVGKPLPDLLISTQGNQGGADPLTPYVMQTQASSQERRHEVTGRRADGSQFPLEISVALLDDVGGTYQVATVRDITELKKDQSDRIDLTLKYGGIAKDLAAMNLALEQAHRRELEIGSHIQKAMLVNLPDQTNQNLWVSSFNQASRGIDGDFFDVLNVGTSAVDLVAGDVMGKGVPAALLGAAIKLQFQRSLVELMLERVGQASPPQPQDIVTRVNKSIAPNLYDLDAFVTLIYIRIDLVGNKVSWVGCGHEESLVLDQQGRIFVLENQHPPVGIFLDEEFVQAEHPFLPADSLFLASDGASDAITGKGQRIGRELLNAFVQKQLRVHRSPSMALHTVRRDLLTDAIELTDDLTLVMLTRPVQNLDAARLEIPIALHSLNAVRSFVIQRAQSFGMDEESAGLLTVAAVEIVTNIIRHAKGLLWGAPIEVISDLSATELNVWVKYIGEYYAPPAHIPDTDFGSLAAEGLDALPEGGFGLSIIQHAADHVEYLHKDGVNLIHLQVRK